MGWNAAYAILESTVIGSYDLGVLDEPLLRVLMEPYRDSDIDSGGSRDLESKDGLECMEIVVKVFQPDVFEKLLPTKNAGDGDDYYEAIFEAWCEVTRKEFGYW